MGVCRGFYVKLNIGVLQIWCGGVYGGWLHQVRFSGFGPRAKEALEPMKAPFKAKFWGVSGCLWPNLQIQMCIIIHIISVCVL